MSRYDYPFTQKEAEAAHASWGCNCGPTALAFALQVKLDAVREKLVGFESRGYVNPSMMREALTCFGKKTVDIRAPKYEGANAMFRGPVSLVRIQWTGPWTADGKTAKWAATYTHWICCWTFNTLKMVFDINGGVMQFHQWQEQIVPAIVATIKRADGGWYPANVWQLEGG